jgi:SAM-dependent methyltransferase
VTEQFDADWLTLREPFDHAARSVALAQRLADRLPKRPRLLELGAGTGSLFRWLAPIIGRGQDWILVDADAALLEDAFGRTAAWARQRGFAASAPNDTLLVTTPLGLWRMQALRRDLSSWSGLTRPAARLASTNDTGSDRRTNPANAKARMPLPESDAVLCSALLDLVSSTWLRELCNRLNVPFLACLTVDGRDVWQPQHPNDALVRAAFRHDQRRNKDFGPALGSAAPTSALNALNARGFVTASAPTDWRISRSALRMQRALIDSTADAARNARPSRRRAITAWQETRLRQAMRARLAIRIGHRDILALPPGG